MKAIVTYSDFLTVDNKQILSKISSDLSADIQLDLSIVQKDNGKVCEIKMIDKLGVQELSEIINKHDVKEMIYLLKDIYGQL
ncbi:hypothetical protein [Clostridium tagluense]|uniref:Uncharacterized protein n=1 Tax=Clostridium tagluense TaxID=360422 RepID=A0A401UQH8_9CLOT|nr:hypothetical protein [Clostridium tagluense]GCD11776.1 hypothetical protein Ctaglu_33990 [Clostridium tagluense]